MKKIAYLLLLVMILVIPFAVFAEGEEDGATEEVTATEETDTRVPVYFFRGEGCSHCAEAEAWFESIQEEHGSKFKVVDYETWYNEENANLMQKVASARGETADGVPYIIIGEKSWNGFAESYTSEMIAQINDLSAQAPEERYDIMTVVNGGSSAQAKKTEKSSSNDVVSLLIILAVVFGIGFGVYKARANN